MNVHTDDATVADAHSLRLGLVDRPLHRWWLRAVELGRHTRDRREARQHLANLRTLRRIGQVRPLPEDAEPVDTCRECGCTDDDCHGCIERTGLPCQWVQRDLCSACAGDQP